MYQFAVASLVAACRSCRVVGTENYTAVAANDPERKPLFFAEFVE